MNYTHSVNVIESDYTKEKWKVKREVRFYHFFYGELNNIRYNIEIEERHNKLNTIYNIKILK